MQGNSKDIEQNKTMSLISVQDVEKKENGGK